MAIIVVFAGTRPKWDDVLHADLVFVILESGSLGEVEYHVDLPHIARVSTGDEVFNCVCILKDSDSSSS
ncbi:hypothetical protein BVRB_6g134700 isoform A [Beta vulgaris subsp. vulgaris]|nr:hypothetical protein BVRB_6g134700 isoform A [Beta vulgaris subsp. vulgaris]